MDGNEEFKKPFLIVDPGSVNYLEMLSMQKDYTKAIKDLSPRHRAIDGVNTDITLNVLPS
jgi:hypothetical protein